MKTLPKTKICSIIASGKYYLDFRSKLQSIPDLQLRGVTVSEDIEFHYRDGTVEVVPRGAYALGLCYDDKRNLTGASFLRVDPKTGQIYRQGRGLFGLRKREGSLPIELEHWHEDFCDLVDLESVLQPRKE